VGATATATAATTTLDELKNKVPESLYEYSKRVEGLPMRPLEVEFRLYSPPVVNNFIHLDSLVYWGVLCKTIGEALYGELRRADEKTTHLADPVLPIYSVRFRLRDREKGIRAQRSFYLASVADFGTDAMSVVYWRKRVSYETDRGVVDIHRGIDKAYNTPMPAASSCTARFWCYGNKEEVEDVLKYVTWIGKKGAGGNGSVRSVSVKETGQDRSLFRDGKLNRCIPLYCIRSFDGSVAQAGYRPPYWKPQNQDLCVLPGAKEVVLQEGIRLP